MSLELNIQQEKIELIQWLSTVEDKSILDKIKALRKKESKDWWNTVSNEEKKSIEIGLEDANAGKLKPHSEARKLYEKWL